MNKWIPYVVAAALGLGVAILAFGPWSGGDDKPAAAKTEAPEKAKVRRIEYGEKGTAISPASDETRTPDQVVADALENPPPPPGTLRPQNKAEIEHAARLARPFNQHFAHVSAFWNRAAQLTGGQHPDLAKECTGMTRLLRDQGNLNDDAIDIKGTVEHELALVAKLRPLAKDDEELAGVLDYIEESGKAVLDGKDPTTVLKPSAKKAAAGQ